MADGEWGLARISKFALIAGVIGGGYYACATSAQRMLIRGNEASAIGSMRSIVSAQMTHATTECNGRYASTLTSLGEKGLLSSDLTTADTIEKAGYRITMTAVSAPASADAGQSAACSDSVTAFTATAIPLEPGRTGVRFFTTSAAGEVLQATDASFADTAPVR